MSLQNHKNQIDAPLRLSGDGRIQLSYETLKSILIYHLDSGLYSTGQASKTTARSCVISGYTEWVSKTIPSISIAWDWTLTTITSPPTYEILGQPYSNVSLQDDCGIDLPENKTLDLLSTFIQSTHWKREIETFITKKYS